MQGSLVAPIAIGASTSHPFTLEVAHHLASVYILYSAVLDKFYIGSCKEFPNRFDQHLSHYFPGAFTSKTQDWSVYMLIDDLSYNMARKIESHIKNMKSRKFIENLKKYPSILENLLKKYPE